MGFTQNFISFAEIQKVLRQDQYEIHIFCAERIVEKNLTNRFNLINCYKTYLFVVSPTNKKAKPFY